MNKRYTVEARNDDRGGNIVPTITDDQVVEAAKSLSQPEFTRSDIADKLGVEKTEFHQAFKAARKSGRLEKVRDDNENVGHFRLTAG
jgi:DNA-binding transcriptional regulator LsrR (DeoR family)